LKLRRRCGARGLTDSEGGQCRDGDTQPGRYNDAFHLIFLLSILYRHRIGGSRIDLVPVFDALLART
jgi:hypothetical protein